MVSRRKLRKSRRRRTGDFDDHWGVVVARRAGIVNSIAHSGNEIATNRTLDSLGVGLHLWSTNRALRIHFTRYNSKDV